MKKYLFAAVLAPVFFFLCFAAFAGEVAEKPAPPDEKKTANESETHWLSARMMGSKIGWMNITSKTVIDNGSEFEIVKTELFFRIKRGGMANEQHQCMQVKTDESGRMVDYVNRTEASGGKPKVVRGQFLKDKLLVTTTLGDDEKTKTICEEKPLPKSTVSELEKKFYEGKFKIGHKVEGEVFSPEIGKETGMTLEVEAKKKIPWLGNEVEVWVIKMTTKAIGGGVVVRLFVQEDDRRMPLKMELQGGIISLALTTEQDAKNLDDNFDAMRNLSVGLATPVRNARDVEEARVIFSGEGVNHAMLDTPWQKRTGEIVGDSAPWTLSAPTLSENEAFQIPFDVPTEIEKFRKPAVLIQSDDELMKKTARKIVGDEKNALKALRKICAWVYENIKKKNYTVSFASAKTVLENLEGDCTEHSLLTIALARAAGIPARAVSGLGTTGSSFEYHMWAEGYVGDGVWVPIDPALAEPEIGALHITLYRGEVSDANEIDLGAAALRMIGKLQVKIVELKRRNKDYWEIPASEKTARETLAMAIVKHKETNEAETDEEVRKLYAETAGLYEKTVKMYASLIDAEQMEKPAETYIALAEKLLARLEAQVADDLKKPAPPEAEEESPEPHKKPLPEEKEKESD